jgi:hypothetical protein
LWKRRQVFCVQVDREHGAPWRYKSSSADDKIPHFNKISTTAFLAYFLHPAIQFFPVFIRCDNHSAPRADGPGGMSAALQMHLWLITEVAGEYGVGFGERSWWADGILHGRGIDAMAQEKST